jgi:O-antigen/teichoic acid export membrane protein
VNYIIEWARIGLVTAGAQATVQLLGFVSGLVVIRDLSPEQYAYYTIANTALGTMTVLTDGGVNSGVLAYGGRVWQDRERLGSVLATGLLLRRRLATYAIIVSVPLMAALLHHQGAGWVEVAVVEASILPLFLATVTGQLLEVVPRLHQQLAPLFKVQIGANLGRAAIVLLVLPHWPFAAPASFCAALPQWWANWRLRRLVSATTRWGAPVDDTVSAQLAAQVRRTLPAAAYFALSGQLTVWLVSIFGQAQSVAAVGALGRLAIVFSVLGSVFGMLAVPRFARIPTGDRSRIIRRFWQSNGLVAAACCVPVALLAAFPGQALGVLGPHYTGLEREVVLMAASSVLSTMSACAYSLGAARSVIAPPWFVVPYSMLVQTVLIVILPVDTVVGVIWVGLLNAASQLALHSAYVTWNTHRASAGSR